MKPIQYQIAQIYKENTRIEPSDVVQLPSSASDRVYFRVFDPKGNTILVACNLNVKENKSFVRLTNHFQKHNIHVPKILFVSEDFLTYGLEDLGDSTLYSFIEEKRNTKSFNETELICLYEKSFNGLIDMQLNASKNLDFSLCYPVQSFDSTSIAWDLNYFKYCFLKPSNIIFEEDLLEKDFQQIIEFFCKKDFKYFVFRDFQSRNIMIKDDSVYFIDYQGGRRGPITYDLASCILDSKAELSYDLRDKLINIYFKKLPKGIYNSRTEFDLELSTSLLFRLLQVLGAYGFRGWFQRKEYFIQSIPKAAKNLSHILSSMDFPFKVEYLKSVLQKIIEKYSIHENKTENTKLNVTIYSFSYKKGLPNDTTDNGGGFVFDCRFLLNPGRIKGMQLKTGNDNEIINILKENNEVSFFINQTSSIIIKSIENYLQRGFSSLMVAYGCTGGQHRSVYCAKALSLILENNFKDKVNIALVNRELR